MNMKRMILGGCGIFGLVAAVGLGAAGPEAEEDAVVRMKAQRDRIERLAAPLLERAEKLARFQETRADQEIAVARLTADLDNAEKTLKVMQISVKEYEEGTFPSERQAAEGAIKLAESDLIKAKDRMEWSEKMRKLKQISGAQNQSAKLAVDKAEFTLGEAKNKLLVLTQFTKPKQQTELMAKLMKARSNQLALGQKLENLKEKHAAAEQEAKQNFTLIDPEVVILFRLHEAIALQNQNQFDGAQKKLDEAAELSRVAEERRAQIHFDETKRRLKDATWSLRDRGPKSE